MSISPERIEAAQSELCRMDWCPAPQRGTVCTKLPNVECFCRKAARTILTADAPAILAARIEGMREASEIVRAVPLDPGFDLNNGFVVRVCGSAARAITARIAALQSEMENPCG